MSVPGNGKWKVSHARRCEYGTAHSRRAGAVAACALEARTVFCRGAGRAKAGAWAADPESRAPKTDASRLMEDFACGIVLKAQEGRALAVMTEVSRAEAVSEGPRRSAESRVYARQFRKLRLPGQ